MPYRSGLIQTAVGALFAITFLISNSFGSPTSKHKRVVGTIQKTETDKLILQELNGRRHEFAMSETVPIFLNERTIQLSQVENGRKCAVVYTKNRRVLRVQQLEVFPTHDDFNTETSQSPSV